MDIADATDSKRTKHLLPLSTYIKRTDVYYRYTVIESNILIEETFILLVSLYHPKFNSLIDGYHKGKNIKLIEGEIDI